MQGELTTKNTFGKYVHCSCFVRAGPMQQAAIAICLRCDNQIYLWTDAVATRCGYKHGYAHDACLPKGPPTPEEFDAFNFSALTAGTAVNTEVPATPATAAETPNSSGSSDNRSSGSSDSADSPPAKKARGSTRSSGFFY